jgi:hypothetical protein
MFDFFKNKKIVKRLDARIEILTKHLEIYKKYNSVDEIKLVQEILKELNYIKYERKN